MLKKGGQISRLFFLMDIFEFMEVLLSHYFILFFLLVFKPMFSLLEGAAKKEFRVLSRVLVI